MSIPIKSNTSIKPSETLHCCRAVEANLPPRINDTGTSITNTHCRGQPSNTSRRASIIYLACLLCARWTLIDILSASLSNPLRHLISCIDNLFKISIVRTLRHQALLPQEPYQNQHCSNLPVHQHLSRSNTAEITYLEASSGNNTIKSPDDDLSSNHIDSINCPFDVDLILAHIPSVIYNTIHLKSLSASASNRESQLRRHHIHAHPLFGPQLERWSIHRQTKDTLRIPEYQVTQWPSYLPPRL